MLMVLGECRKHYRNDQDLCMARYPDKQQKSHMAFKRLADHFCRFGTAKQTRDKRAHEFSHEHVDATRQGTTPLCSVFKTSVE